MGISIRIIAVHSDNSLRRIPSSRFDRLMSGDPSERFPEYASQTIPYAELIIVLHNRQPVRFVRIIYPFLPFDAGGRLDMQKKGEEWEASREIWDAHLAGMFGEMSLEESDRQQEYLKIVRDLQHRWDPDESMERRIKEFAIAGELRRLRN